jgi:hypothetical protein
LTIWGIWMVDSLWGWRSGSDVPELLLAWDNYDVEQNYDGFKAACDKVLVDNDIKPEQSRHIVLRVSGDRIMEAFAPAEVNAQPVSQESSG